MASKRLKGHLPNRNQDNSGRRKIHSFLGGRVSPEEKGKTDYVRNLEYENNGEQDETRV